MLIYGSLLCTVGGCFNKRMPHTSAGQTFPRCHKHQKAYDAALNAAMVKLAQEDKLARESVQAELASSCRS